jgi:hypothetical protein
MRLAVALLALAGGCVDDGGPRLQSIHPAAPARGAQVILEGSRLCGASGDCTRLAVKVELGTSSPYVEAQPVTWTATEAQVVIPPATPAGKTMLVVTVDDKASNALAVDVLAGP